MPSYQRDLRSAWAKLNHARRRIAELQLVIEKFFEDKSRRPRMRADFDISSGYHVLRIKSIPNLDSFIENVGLLVGEVIHNLRSGLDHVAWQLAWEYAGGTPVNARKISFPVCDPKQNSPHKVPSYLDTCDWQRLHEFQPCKGINGRADSWSGDYVHQLTLLQAMWNEDKHKMLPIILMTSNAFSMIPTRSSLPPWILHKGDSFKFLSERMLDPDPDAESLDFSHSDYLVIMEAEVGRIKVPAWRAFTRIEDVGEVTPRVALEGLRPLDATLGRLADYVKLILDSMCLPC